MSVDIKVFENTDVCDNFQAIPPSSNRVYGLETDSQGLKMGRNLNAMPVTARNHL